MSFTREINPETLSLLQRLYRQSKHHKVSQRSHCIILRNEGLTVPQLLTIFLVSRKTLYNWFESWEMSGVVGLYDKPGRGRNPTFTPEQEEQIKKWTQDHPKQLKQVLHKIKERWGITISLKTLQRVLKSTMSWHRFRRAPWGEPDPQEYAQKKIELEELKVLDEEGKIDLYYLDQSGFSLVSSIPSGWQPIGETLKIPSSRSKRLNVLGIMNRQNDLKSYTSEQSINSDVVILCIDTFFPKVDRHTVIVMDQASIHTSHAVQDKLEEWRERDIEIFELPSYSPELNLIEILWRFIKYEWIELSAYQCWNSLVDYVEKVLVKFGDEYVINFV